MAGQLRILSTVLLLLLAACSSTQPEVQEVIVTRDERELPEGCSPRKTAELTMRLLDAFNRGDQEQFTQFFPQTFQWYSDGWRTEIKGVNIDKDHLFVSRPGNREALPNYSAERHQQGDRLQLYKASMIERDHRRALVIFQLFREADDVEPGVDGSGRRAAPPTLVTKCSPGGVTDVSIVGAEARSENARDRVG
jgi:hypothetical protein